jgi:glycosyltransferase involved in cell wall biosynthesis
MKIFIIGPAFPLRGGPAQFNENLCRAMLKEGIHAEIISYSLQYPSFLFPGSTQYETEAKSPSDITIHTLINTVNPFNWVKTARFIKKQNPDAILFRFWLPFFGPSLGTIARLVRLTSNIKVFALTDNVIPHEKRFGDKIFTKYFIKSCHGFVTMSQKVYNDLSVFTSTDLKICTPHPMYETYGEGVIKKEAREKLGLNENDKIVLFFGLIRKYKGLDLLMEAFADARIKDKNIKLLIAGEYYEDPAYYEKLAVDLGINDQIIYHTRFIPNDMVKYYFCASDLVAQTYRNATNSGVTMVGYYYEKPMLVTAVGGLAEIVPHGIAGYAVAPNKDEISESIIDYFENNKAEFFKSGIKAEKEKYSWSKFIDAFKGLISRTK